MRDIAMRLVWLFVSLSMITYAIFLMIGSMIQAQAIDQSRIVAVRDVLAPGVHHLSGMVMMPRTCAQLTVASEMVSSGRYRLIFKSWDVPSIPCSTEDTPRSFRTIVFAPAAGVQFVGTLDEAPLTLVVHPALRDSLDSALILEESTEQ